MISQIIKMYIFGKGLKHGEGLKQRVKKKKANKGLEKLSGKDNDVA